MLPLPRGLRLQAVHGDDVGEAYRLACTEGSASGAYNVAAEPVLDAKTLGPLLGARVVEVPPRPGPRRRRPVWRLRLQPTPPGWLDMGLAVPVMDCSRIRDELGWAPRHTAGDALLELLGGLRDSAGASTPPLHPDAGGRFRSKEFATGVGGRSF